jgi:polyketide cyclase/dehydrase/lipid transport protein
MKSRLLIAAAAGSLLASAALAADYTSTVMTRELKVPAAVAWSRIGGFCTLEKFLPGMKCSYSAGTGGVATVRKMSMGGNGGEEVMIAQTSRSYSYAMRASPLFYHGTVAVEPVGPRTSRLIYTFVWDQETLSPEDRARDKASRDKIFTPALDRMKAVAEGK